ncbi:MAG: glycoside hydrolase family 43 protein [Planctomycetota bacterium]
MQTNATLWKDTQDNSIQAHGGGLLCVDNVWYWYGENKAGPTTQTLNAQRLPVERVDLVGISGYRSIDLVNWEPMGVVLEPEPNIRNHDLHPSMVLERPKVVFHQATGTFVMWVHIDRPDYKLAAAGVAVSDRPKGPFRYLGSIRPQGRDSRDQTVFVDDDGSAYHFASTDMNATTLVTRLTDDYRAMSDESMVLFPDRHMEAHAITKAQGRYWYLASGCTGWDPNEARSAVADRLDGPWEELGNPCRGGDRPELTWGSQCTFLQTLPNGQILAMFDIWKPQALGQSQYVWIAGTPGPDGLQLEWSPVWAGLTPAVTTPEVAAPQRTTRKGQPSPAKTFDGQPVHVGS